MKEPKSTRGMRLIDANEILAIIENLRITDSEAIVHLIENARTVRPTCEIRQGDIVYNTNNQTHGIAIAHLPDKGAVTILEMDGKGKFFVNCPPLGAIVNTGKHLYLANIIKNALED